MKVLIIEDTKPLAQTLADLVGEAGHSADLVFDGDTGLEYARSGLYDAIVLDVMLPGVNGKRGSERPYLRIRQRSRLLSDKTF